MKNIQHYQAAKDTLSLHLDGVPILIAGLKIERFNRTQLSILHMLAQLGREQEISELVRLDPTSWRKQGQLSDIFKRLIISCRGASTEMSKRSLDELIVFDRLKRCNTNPDIKDKVKIHEQLYYKKFGRRARSYRKDSKAIRIVRLHKHRAQIKAQLRDKKDNT